MFIKLTKFNGVVCQFNTSFILMVEPSSRGGSFVTYNNVSFDYFEFEESPEQIMELINEHQKA